MVHVVDACLSRFLDLHCDTCSLRVKKDSHASVVLEVYLEVDDEAAFLSCDEQLVLRSIAFEELDLPDEAHWHSLLVDYIHVLVEYNQLEIE